MDIYNPCLVLQNNKFILRLPNDNDLSDLFEIYSDENRCLIRSKQKGLPNEMMQKIRSYFLYLLLSLKTQLNVLCGERTGLASINRNMLNRLKIAIPNEYAINIFEAIVKPMDSAILTNYDENCRLASTRDALLPKLMNGEVDVSDIDI